MLTPETSKGLVRKISGITKNPLAILDLTGNVLAKTDNFKIQSSPIDISGSKKKIPLSVEGEKIGYIYFDVPESVFREEGDVLKSMIELILHQHLVLENITLEDRKINKFIYDLLHQVDYDRDEAIAEAKVYGFDLERPRMAMIVDLGGEIQKTLYSENLSCNEKDSFWAKIKRSLTSSTESFFTRNRDNIVAYIGSSRFVILKDIGDGSSIKENFNHILKTLNSFHYILKNEFRNDVSMGIGKYYPGIDGLKRSFDEALLAMNFGEQVWGGNRIYNFDSFGVVAPLISGADKIDFPKNIFEDFSNEELKQTLNVFFDNDMSLTSTAKKLKIHRNTLVYRLEKIAENLKLDPRVFNDAVQIRLSMLFGEILEVKGN